MDKSEESLNREMNCPTMAGMTAVSAWGRMMRRMIGGGAIPSACPASF